MSQAPQTFCVMNSNCSCEEKMIFQYMFCFIYFTTALTSTQSEECYVYSASYYDGIYNITETGYSCQRWDIATLSFTVTDENFPFDGSVQNANNYCRDPFRKGFLWCPSTNPNSETELCNIQECGREKYFLVPDGLDMKRCRHVTDEKTLCNADEEFSCGNESSTILTDLETRGECTCCSRRGDTRAQLLQNTAMECIAPGNPRSIYIFVLCPFVGRSTAMECIAPGNPRSCFETSSEMYEGTWHHSEDGQECQPWFTLLPQLTLDNFPDETGTGANNYCRDPFNLGITVCFTKGNGLRVNITRCGIPLCREIASRHNYDHDCYTPTDKDRSHPSLPESPTAKQLCELQPNRFFMDLPNDDYPGCTNCSCCQIKECYRGPAYKYNGTWSRTVGGRQCSKWTDNMVDPEIFLIESENYCRALYGEKNTYCRTNDPNFPFEECDLQTTCDGAASGRYNNVTQSFTVFPQFFDFTPEADVENTSSTTETFTETIINGSTPAGACTKEYNAFQILVIVVLIHSNLQLINIAV